MNFEQNVSSKYMYRICNKNNNFNSTLCRRVAQRTKDGSNERTGPLACSRSSCENPYFWLLRCSYFIEYKSRRPINWLVLCMRELAFIISFNEGSLVMWELIRQPRKLCFTMHKCKMLCAFSENLAQRPFLKPSTTIEERWLSRRVSVPCAPPASPASFVRRTQARRFTQTPM